MNSIKVMLIYFSFIVINYAQAETNLFEIKLDKSNYAVGESSLLKATIFSKPDNSEYQFDILATLNNVPIATDSITEYQMFSIARNLTSGSYTWSVKLVIQDANYATDLKSTINFYDNKIIDIESKIAATTDPVVLADLQAQKDKYAIIKSAAIAELNSIRTPVSNSKTINFSVQ